MKYVNTLASLISGATRIANCSAVSTAYTE